MNDLNLSLLVSNHSGVLVKVAGLFGRRGCSIRSLSMDETSEPAVSRITVLASGSEDSLNQIFRQVTKLEDVMQASML